MLLRELYMKCSTTWDDRLCNFKTNKKEIYLQKIRKNGAPINENASGKLASLSSVVKAAGTEVR